MGDRPTRDVATVKGGDLPEIQKSLLRIASELRTVGLGLQADKIEKLAEKIRPPSLHPIFREVDAPYVVPNNRFFVEQLTEAIELVEELMLDAEITGSLDAYERAQEWLKRLGVREPGGI